jgi:hypothetical protein
MEIENLIRREMKALCIWLVIIIMVLFAVIYVYQIRKKIIKPALATWITFLLGTGLSLTTYAIAENHDFRSGILNTLDFASVGIIVITIIIYGGKRGKLEIFHKLYFIGVGIIILYGFFSGNAWNSNIFAQVLIGIGYIPTIRKLLVQKKNTESFVTWGLSIVAGILALYPAIIGGNSLAVIYAVRTIVLVSLLMLLMLYFEFQSRKVK